MGRSWVKSFKLHTQIHLVVYQSIAVAYHSIATPSQFSVSKLRSSDASNRKFYAKRRIRHAHQTRVMLHEAVAEVKTAKVHHRGSNYPLPNLQQNRHLMLRKLWVETCAAEFQTLLKSTPRVYGFSIE
eukprot:1899003-Pyramimonas_sp.AAC.2